MRNPSVLVTTDADPPGIAAAAWAPDGVLGWAAAEVGVRGWNRPLYRRRALGKPDGWLYTTDGDAHPPREHLHGWSEPELVCYLADVVYQAEA